MSADGRLRCTTPAEVRVGRNVSRLLTALLAHLYQLCFGGGHTLTNL
jgi:hypothetical protein